MHRAAQLHKLPAEAVAIDDAILWAARCVGGYGERSENSEQRTGALKRALETIDRCQQAFRKLALRGGDGPSALQDGGATAREGFEELPKHGPLCTHFVLIFKIAIIEKLNCEFGMAR